MEYPFIHFRLEWSFQNWYFMADFFAKVAIKSFVADVPGAMDF